jgi:hypothetical protein
MNTVVQDPFRSAGYTEGQDRGAERILLDAIYQ